MRVCLHTLVCCELDCNAAKEARQNTRAALLHRCGWPHLHFVRCLDCQALPGLANTAEAASNAVAPVAFQARQRNLNEHDGWDQS